VDKVDKVDKVVLDASAVLAVLQEEPGAERVLEALKNFEGTLAISSVNFCEVCTKLVREKASPADLELAVAPFRSYVVAFDDLQAQKAAELYPQTSSLGLSLGDRACLALAASIHAKVWTTDRAWKKLKIGVEVEVIRK
jgi:PIN domain nuclease of toxin-antitoxin system